MKRLITEQEEQAYRLCSLDFYGLTYASAAILLHCNLNTVWRTLNRLKVKAPQLFYVTFNNCGVRVTPVNAEVQIID